jgi:hypothetical protein
VAGTAVASMLGLSELKQVVMRHRAVIPIQRLGDLFVIGGPNSTDECMIAWEYEMPTANALRRKENPTLPLRWHWIVDIEHPAVVDAAPMGYVVDSLGARGAGAWPLVDVNMETGKTKRLLLPEPSDEIVAVSGRKAFVPLHNYLLVTRLPNFLDPRIDQWLELDRSQWPHILAIEGTHSIGTKAAELLASSGGLEALTQAEHDVHGATEFQLLFRVTRICTTFQGIHRFRRVEFVDAQRLDAIGASTYQLAHMTAMRRLHELDEGTELRPKFLAESKID